MPSSSWYSFKQLVKALQRDYPNSFVPPPGIPREAFEDMVLTLRDGFLLAALPCNKPQHQSLYEIGKSHRHAEDGQWHVRVLPEGEQEGDIS
jgi:hypothetical protein